MSTPSIVVTPEPTRHPNRQMVVLGVAVPFAASKIIGPWAAVVLPGAFGAVCAISVARGRPLLAVMAARRAAGRPGLAARMGAPGVADALAKMTAVWAVVMLVEAAVLARLVSASTPHAGALGTAISWGVQFMLVVITIGYVRNRRLAARTVR